MIEIKRLSKCFQNKMVLQDISFSISPGTITGIIGRNGSGKTVLFKCLCGFLLPSDGQILINGIDVTRKRDRNGQIGAIIEEPGFLEEASGYQNLKYLSLLRGMIGKEEIIRSLEQVELLGEEKKKVKKYSMGMRQRLGIAQALMENPPILILDEPMNGLDQKGVEDISHLLLELKEAGKTILLTSHSREEIERLCDTVYRIDAGRIVSIR